DDGFLHQHLRHDEWRRRAWARHDLRAERLLRGALQHQVQDPERLRQRRHRDRLGGRASRRPPVRPPARRRPRPGRQQGRRVPVHAFLKKREHRDMRGLRIALGLALLSWAGATCATAGGVQVIKDLCEGSACDRDFSNAALTMDSSGQIFGVNDLDGDNAKGSIFRLRFNPDRQTWGYKTLYSFCAQADCADGGVPRGRLIADVNGNLYGTASSGGPTGHGTIFRLTPSGQFDVLYGFCPANDSCPDGATPNIGLTYRHASSGALYDGVSPLYGASVQGGSFNGGTAFQLAQSESGWTFK